MMSNQTCMRTATVHPGSQSGGSHSSVPTRLRPAAGFVTLSALIVAGFLASAGCRDESGSDETNDTAAAFCEEHQIAESQCVWCDPNLVESLGFCNGHGVPEAYCYQCNPNLIPAFKAIGDWCAGHERPESQCYLCNPELDPANQKSRDLSSIPEPLTRSDTEEVRRVTPPGPEPLTRRQRPPTVTCAKENLVIRLESPAIALAAGFEFASSEIRPLSEIVTCTAEVTYDENAYARVSAQVSGVASNVHEDLGAGVRRGDPLVTIESAQLGAAQAVYLQALSTVGLWERNHQTESRLLENGVSTERDYLEADAQLTKARIGASQAKQALLNLGLSDRDINALVESEDTRGRYVVRAPFDGTVVERHVTRGEVITPSSMLFSIADIRHMWAFLDIYEADLPQVRTGNPVVLNVESLPGHAFPGFIDWVSPELDPRTRTLRARAEFDNSQRLLRANMFAEASIVVRNQERALVVPAESVQWEGCCNVVFVKTGEATFVPRKVHLGISTGNYYEVLDGLAEGEEVVTQGSFLLKTEILKGSIGAGCCEVDPGA